LGAGTGVGVAVGGTGVGEGTGMFVGTAVGVAGGLVAVGRTSGVGVTAGVGVKVGLGVLVGGTGVALGPSCVQPVARSSEARTANRTRFRYMRDVLEYWILDIGYQVLGIGDCIQKPGSSKETWF
jgi:hypothetical protein